MSQELMVKVWLAMVKELMGKLRSQELVCTRVNGMAFRVIPPWVVLVWLAMVKELMGKSQVLRSI